MAWFYPSGFDWIVKGEKSGAWSRLLSTVEDVFQYFPMVTLSLSNKWFTVVAITFITPLISIKLSCFASPTIVASKCVIYMAID